MFVGGVVTPMIGMAALAYFDGCDPVKGYSNCHLNWKLYVPNQLSLLQLKVENF